MLARPCRTASVAIPDANTLDRPVASSVAFRIPPPIGLSSIKPYTNRISGLSPGADAVLVCDGAGWHQTGGRLVVPDNITLLPLPSYSPQLNPIENVWAYMRGNYLNRRVWASYDQIVDACCTAWNALISDTNRVSSITQREWAKVNN